MPSLGAVDAELIEHLRNQAASLGNKWQMAVDECYALRAELAFAREEGDRTRIEVHTEKRLIQYRDRAWKAEDELDTVLRLVRKIKAGAESQGAFSGMSWREVVQLCDVALFGR